MSDVAEIKCEKALLQRKVMWCIAVDNFCAYQRHCPTRGRAILTDEAKTCKYRNKTTKEK